MQALRILANCLASGQPLEAGRVYRVPAEISQFDADALVRMGRAIKSDVCCEPPTEALAASPGKPARKKRHVNP
jgi:hypothetical protein